MKGLEPLWYEISPYVYGIIGIAAILISDTIGEIFGAILLTAAATIVGMRRNYRRLEEEKRGGIKPWR